jgi:hypothetical protein
MLNNLETNNIDTSMETNNKFVIPEVYMEYLKINNILTEKILTDKNFTTEITDEECPVCFKQIDITDGIITDCGHKYCMSCTLGTIWSCMKTSPYKIPSCPLCRQELHIKSIHPLIDK